MKQTAQASTIDSIEAFARESYDRRRHPRFRSTSTIRFANTDLFGQTDIPTEDVSCSGFSFFARRVQIPAGGFYCSLIIPDPDMGGLALQCRVRVVSTAAHTQGFHRVGCRIEDYFVLPDTAPVLS